MASSFFQQVLENDESLISAKTLYVLCKSFLSATQHLDDISYSVSPASRLVGDLFKAMTTKVSKDAPIGAEPIKIIMVKFFFHHTTQVRTDLFYMLSNWLVYQGKKVAKEGFSSMQLLMKMYLIGIYTEDDKVRRADMISHYCACTDSFDDESTLCFIGLVVELCTNWTIKEFLNINEDKDMEEMIKDNKNWAQTSEETISSVRVFLSLGELVWFLYQKLKPARKLDAIKLFCQHPKNTLCQIFSLSIVLNFPDTIKDKDLKSLPVPIPEEHLEVSNKYIITPQTDTLIHTFMTNLDSQVREYLSSLEYPELTNHMFKVLQLLQHWREKKGQDILASIESIKDDVGSFKPACRAQEDSALTGYGQQGSFRSLQDAG